VARIGAFYHLDGQWQAADPDERRRRRQDEIGPLVNGAEYGASVAEQKGASRLLKMDS
jgi:hypothetical protein